jgi:mRNA-degrading endonuclease toxin of MazEF toxin-antitoxin module
MSYEAQLQREALKQQVKSESDIMLDQIRTIDNRRLMGNSLTELSSSELATVQEYLEIVLGFQDHETSFQ